MLLGCFYSGFFKVFRLCKFLVLSHFYLNFALSVLGQSCFRLFRLRLATLLDVGCLILCDFFLLRRLDDWCFSFILNNWLVSFWLCRLFFDFWFLLLFYCQHGLRLLSCERLYTFWTSFHSILGVFMGLSRTFGSVTLLHTFFKLLFTLSFDFLLVSQHSQSREFVQIACW